MKKIVFTLILSVLILPQFSLAQDTRTTRTKYFVFDSTSTAIKTAIENFKLDEPEQFGALPLGKNVRSADMYIEEYVEPFFEYLSNTSSYVKTSKDCLGSNYQKIILGGEWISLAIEIDTQCSHIKFKHTYLNNITTLESYITLDEEVKKTIEELHSEYNRQVVCLVKFNEFRQALSKKYPPTSEETLINLINNVKNYECEAISPDFIENFSIKIKTLLPNKE